MQSGIGIGIGIGVQSRVVDYICHNASSKFK
jgi:hypothetical protein